jgi:hypothetical protein
MLPRADFDRQVSEVRRALLEMNLTEEVRWLDLAATAPDLCSSTRAVKALTKVGDVALSLRYPAVSVWIYGQVLNGIQPRESKDSSSESKS